MNIVSLFQNKYVNERNRFLTRQKSMDFLFRESMLNNAAPTGYANGKVKNYWMIIKTIM